MLVAVPLDPLVDRQREHLDAGVLAEHVVEDLRQRDAVFPAREADHPAVGVVRRRVRVEEGVLADPALRALLDRPAAGGRHRGAPRVGGVVVDRVVSAPVTLHRCRVADARGYPFRAGGVGRGGADGEHRLGQPATRCRRFRHGFARGVASIRCDRLPDRRQPRSGHPAPPSGPAGGEPPHPAVAPRVQPPARLPRHRCSGRPHRCGLAVHTDPGPVQLADAQRGRHDLRRGASTARSTPST